MEMGYKFRLYPTPEQAELIQKTFGCVRFVYNHYLNQRRTAYQETGKSPTRFQQDKDLTALKKECACFRRKSGIMVGRDTPEPRIIATLPEIV